MKKIGKVIVMDKNVAYKKSAGDDKQNPQKKMPSLPNRGGGDVTQGVTDETSSTTVQGANAVETNTTSEAIENFEDDGGEKEHSTIKDQRKKWHLSRHIFLMK